MSPDTPSAAGPRPVLRLLHGATDPGEIAAELAALVAVLAARTGDNGETVRADQLSAWSDRARAMRPPGFPSPGGWRRSALPR